MGSGFYAEGSTGFLIGGSFAFVLMLVFNVLVLSDNVKEFVKFIPMSFKQEDKATLQKQLVRMGSSFSALGGAALLTSSRKNWAKVRGAMKMGVLHEASPKGK